jgi:hypothetical protein
MVHFKKFIFLTAPYDKTRHPVLGNMIPNPPDETAPWTICITNGPTQYLYTSDSEPGRIYKLALPGGEILGKFGISGHEIGQELAAMADYFRVLGVEARKRYDMKMPAGVAAAEIRLGPFDNWIGPERLIMDVVRWYEEWDNNLTPDYNAAAVRGATAEYNQVKANQNKSAELIPLERMELMAHGC